MKEANPIKTRKTAISIMLLIVTAYLFLQGVIYTDPAWPQSEDITKAVYLVGAAVVFALTLISWSKE